MNYNDLNRTELIELCKERNIISTGNYKTLISRLIKAEQSESMMPEIFPKKQEINILDIPTKAVVEILSEGSFYLHLIASNLSNYFTFGYFYPLALEESEIYKNENRANDVLSFFEEYIIVARAPINKFESSDVLVELVLDKIKVDEFESSGLYYVAEPIPISRVKTVYFKTDEAKATFLSSIKTFPDSFIPFSICKTISGESGRYTEIGFENIKLPRNESLSKWKDKLNLFDKILGLFAFEKNASIFYAERENKFENYSQGFFSTLNLINPVKQLIAYKENIYLKPLVHYRNLDINSPQRIIFKSIIERVYANKQFDFKIAIEILENSVSNENLKNGELADSKEQIDLFKKLEKLAISYKEVLQREVIRKNQNLPALSLLFLSKFSNQSRQHTDKQAVRNAFIQNEFAAPLNVAEYILGFLGLYYGYKSMIKEDTNLDFSDNTFDQLATKSQSIKFKLESYFERFIIESVFQFAVQQKVLNDDFNFLDWNKEESNLKPVAIIPNTHYDYFDKSYKLMGQEIISVLRQDKIEKILDKISNQYSDRVEDTSYLVTFVKKHLKIDKQFILDLLRRKKGNYPMDELEKVVDLDTKTNK